MSDILIRGMEMPKNCASCKFVDSGECGLLPPHELFDFTKRRDKYCPLIPAPPHGRLIVFPCEVDDVLYEVDDPSFGVVVCKVYSVNYSRQRARLADDEEMRDCVSVLVKVIEGHGVGSSYSFDMEDFGKSIFLTREEAEAALAAPTIIPASEEGE